MLTALATSGYYTNYGGLGYGWFDPTYMLVIIGLAITLIASANVKGTFNKYDKVKSRRGITGAECARRILDANGLKNIQIEHVSGNLSDHFSPKENVIRLSDSTYNSTSIAALGVAAHECGHAVQHQVGYVPIKIRNGIVPVVNICSYAAIPIIFIGIILSMTGLAMLGVVLYCAVFAFQLVTIPTETNASARAMKTLESMALLDEDELKGAQKVLTAAALTYFASAAATALQVLRLALIVVGNGNRNNRR
ncbi:MAG: zinc metallopeptidase [Clostridia bacterium]|nr:zinc metallopeptidase [Clostridia bacterium]